MNKEVLAELVTREPPLTYQEIGNMFGISRERVRQLAVVYGLKKQWALSEKRRRNKALLHTCPCCGGPKSRISKQCAKCRGKSSRGKGKFLDAKGYVRLARWNRPGEESLQHRVVAASILGRVLTHEDRVFHRNGDRQDNAPENLIVKTSDGTTACLVEAPERRPHGQ